MERRKRKESVCEQEDTKLKVPPLNSERLQPVRHRTKNAVLTLLDNGEVYVEHFKKRSGLVSFHTIYFSLVYGNILRDNN